MPDSALLNLAFLLPTLLISLLLARHSAPLASGVHYYWGDLCGYQALPAVPLILLHWLTVDDLSATAAMLLSCLCAAAGIGLLGKRRFGVMAFFAASLTVPAAFAFRLDWGSQSVCLAAIIPAFILLGGLLANVVYFRNRWMLLR